ncbi:hypothetical protein C5167_021059 [Papaver somniferum]|uniref:Uncharacterized protein n=1 Tax=Papaver somniferum TaxID=3469 RepID=A0A4Y7IUS5_PAPSO|nr:hypothetical protein C5167_021059 [Papaver somniferum]
MVFSLSSTFMGLEARQLSEMLPQDSPVAASNLPSVRLPLRFPFCPCDHDPNEICVKPTTNIVLGIPVELPSCICMSGISFVCLKSASSAQLAEKLSAPVLNITSEAVELLPPITSTPTPPTIHKTP